MSSSYRPHPLRQSQTADNAPFRQPSNASSSASSGYSNTSSGTFEVSRTSMSSSPSSVYSTRGHKRGQSEVVRRPPAYNSQTYPSTAMAVPENLYSAARQSLRPLPQVPRPTTPPRPASRHDRGHSVDIGRLSIANHAPTSPTPPTPPTPPLRSSGLRPVSMLLTRSDSVRRNSDAGPQPLIHAHTTPLTTPDLEMLGRSSTNQLRALSKLAQIGTAEEFAINSPTQEVTGLRGRRRLQRTDKGGSNRPAQRTGGYGWEGRDWMDKQRQFLQAYEYLCHIGEAKEWIEDIIQRTIPPIVELEEALRNGVTLAEVVESLNPQRRFKIFHHPRLQFRHSDNIAIFFRYLDEVQLPDLFRFELIDLYEKKNIPKVIHCIHALSWLLFRKGIVDFRIGNLVGQLEFEHHELEAMQKGLDKLGTSMPSFGNMGADFGVVEEPPEPEETEEERIDRELAGHEAAMVDLQAQIRGAVLRMQLGETMQNLWESEDWLIDLQARIRGDFTRQIMGYRLEMRRFAIRLQSAARGFLARRLQTGKQEIWKSVEGDILKLQSLARAIKARHEVQDQRSQLKLASGPIRGIQATARGFLLRSQTLAQQQDVKHTAAPVMGLQAAVRGLLLRTRLEEDRIELQSQARVIAGLQAASRAALMRGQVALQNETLQSFGPMWTTLQAATRAALTRNQISTQQGDLESPESMWETLQAAARGSLTRNRISIQQEVLESFGPMWETLQAAARGSLTRDRISQQQETLESFGPVWETLQAAARGSLTRDQISLQQEVLESFGPMWETLQAAARGSLTRDRISQQHEALESSNPMWETLQAAARAVLTRNQVELQREALESLGPMWGTLQAACRGNLARDNVEALRAELLQHSPSLGLLQAHARGGAVRREVSDKLESLEEAEDDILVLQSTIRGVLERNRLSELLGALEEEEDSITQLQSHIRGSLHRGQQHEFLEELEDNELEVSSLQSLARAMLLRESVAQVLDELEEQEESIGEIQSAAKAFVVRAKFEEKKRHYNENMQKVVKIQSFVRAKLQGEAYKSLTSGKNPPVNAVKNFVHLLNDSDFDFNEEIEFERMRKTVGQQVRQNEMLEQYIDQLDIKIALLVKNKITLDEVVKHQHNFGGHASNILANSSIASVNQFDLKALNKGSRKKLESYQQLFFALQTQPQYLSRLFKRRREQGISEKEAKRTELLMMGLFGYAQKRREEYYLLKLIGRSIREEVESCSTLQDYLRANFFWARLFSNYTRSPRDRKYLRDLLGPLVRDNIVEDPELDLESDPMQIYRSAINNEELRTGQPSNRPLDVPRELAIKDPETKAVFIDHLRDLREICDQFLSALEDLLARMPYGLRFVCRQNFDALCQRFQRENQQRLLQVVTNWLWKFYLQPAVTAPENVGVVDKQLSPLQKRNLGEVAKVLGQIASGRQFGGDNIYLQPLNAFIAESIERLAHLTENLVAVPDAESTFDIDEFNDLYAKNKPTLYIKMTDIFAIHNIIAADLPSLCPNRDDILREILQDLGSAKHNESEMAAAGSPDIQLFLTPKLHELEDPEADMKALFMETKRCILYIIRVQTGANLLDILVKPILPEDEHKWRMLLRDEFSRGSNTRQAYSDANMVDVTTMSYYDLKRVALENVMRLEQMGRISRQNFYQDLLNAIAVDIRTKSRRRVQRQRELEGVRLTLGNLHEKAKYLEQQRKSYDDYIEQAMATLQNKKGKKRFLLPFTKQYNHQRELERSGRVPKFGSYKYSARALSDKGVLVAWQGLPERDWGQINLTISCDEVGVFSLEGSRGHIQIPGASALVPIEDLLQAQFEAHQFMGVFECAARLNVNLLLHLLYKKFYRTQ